MEIRHHCNVPLSSCLKVKVKVFLTPEEEQKKHTLLIAQKFGWIWK